MNVYRVFSFFLAFLLLNLQIANAATVLGKVSIYTNLSSHPEVLPLVSDKDVNVAKYKALIKVSGGSLIADKGALFKAVDRGEITAFHIQRGSMIFRLLPHKAGISFVTNQGVISSPGVIQASTSLLEGKIVVDNKGTKVELSEGTLLAKTSEGTSNISAGDKILLPSNGEVAQIIQGNSECTDAEVKAALVGETGMFQNQAPNPYGDLSTQGVLWDAVLVNDKLEVVDIPDVNQD